MQLRITLILSSWRPAQNVCNIRTINRYKVLRRAHVARPDTDSRILDIAIA
jgi:hypothetical protein